MDTPAAPARAFADFVRLIARLRAPGGCPWDREQTHASLKPMTIEEAYEVLMAIDEGTDEELAGELGDLLLQVVFHAQIAAEEGRFTVARRHRRASPPRWCAAIPTSSATRPPASSGEVLRNWEALKQAERKASGKAAAGGVDAGQRARAACPR